MLLYAHEIGHQGQKIMRIKDLIPITDAPVVENTLITPTVQRLLESDAQQDQWVEYADADSFFAYCDKIRNG